MDPIRGIADLTQGTWEEFRVGLADYLRILAASEVVTIEVMRPPESSSANAPGKASHRLWRRFRSDLRDNVPSLSFTRLADILCCVCTGPVEDGGWVRLSAAQQQKIRELGWGQATRRDGDHWAYPNYRAYFPHREDELSQPPVEPSTTPYIEIVDTDRAARLAVDTFRGPLQVATPQRLRLNGRS